MRPFSNAFRSSLNRGSETNPSSALLIIAFLRRRYYGTSLLKKSIYIVRKKQPKVLVALERTAYPRFGRVITSVKLERSYTPTQEALAWIRAMVRKPNHRERFGDNTLNMTKPPEPWLDDQASPRKRPTRLPRRAALPFVKRRTMEIAGSSG